MAGIVYILCGGTSLACAILLFLGFWRSGVRLLLWSGLCFLALTLDNVIQFLDAEVFPDVSLAAYSRLPGLVGLALLVGGMIWESAKTRMA